MGVLIPELTPSGAAEVEAGRPIGVPPPTPRSFRPLSGPPRNVTWSTVTRIVQGSTAAQKAGLRYEAKVHQFLTSQLGPSYHISPRLDFEDDAGRRYLFPDGLYLSAYGTAIIFEIKIQHMAEAWWQLRELYAPVVSALPFVNRVSCVEVVRSYDPAMGFPEDAVVTRSVQGTIEAPGQPLKVLVWRP